MQDKVEEMLIKEMTRLQSLNDCLEKQDKGYIYSQIIDNIDTMCKIAEIIY